jgi:hypothetical protein
MKISKQNKKLSREGLISSAPATAIIAGVLIVLTFELHAALDTSGTATKKPIHTATVSPELAAQLAAVEKLPTIDALPFRTAAVYYSAQCPIWPAMPGNEFSLPLWDLGDGSYLIDDLAINYNTFDTLTTTMAMSASAKPMGGGGPLFDLSSGVPYLTVAPTGTNQLLVTVINNTGPVNYELWWTPSLANPAYPWSAVTVGTTGQTNFTVNIGAYPTAFFRAIWDTNGIPMWEAADPANPGAGILAVFIDNPTNGTVLQ